MFLCNSKAQCMQSLKENMAIYCEAIVEESSTRRSKITVVLEDGYDELQKMVKLTHLESDGLHKSSVVIISYFTASVELHNMVERSIEILGFTKDDRKA